MDNSGSHGQIADLNGNRQADKAPSCDQDTEMNMPPVRVCWPVTFIVLIEHLGMLYAFTLLLQGRLSWYTVAYGMSVALLGGLATTVGAHRLWTHRSYKAKWPLRLLLAILQVLAAQGSIWQWVAWHRAHHKHSEKSLDPHNASRGFFWAHIGWLLTYDPKLFKMQLETVNMEDVEADPIVMWQERNYSVLVATLTVLVELIPPYFFGVNHRTAIAMCHCTRIVITWHSTFLVNSAAHLYGYKPYDKNINPAENKLVSILALGEGWHNYHHTFPWDYRTSEYGGFYRVNPSAAMIDFFARIGLAYDLKSVSPELLASRKARTGMNLVDTSSANDEPW